MNLKRIFITLVLLTGFSSVSISQADGLLASFSITQSENKVVINFSIHGGASCDGVILERRLESDTDYKVAGGISGVCGGSEFEEFYTIVDEAPYFNETNIYRLRLGNQGFSRENSIIVVELVDDYKIYPQPANDQLFIQFDNPNQEPVSLSIFSLDGKTVLNNVLSNQALISVDVSDFRQGIYFFELVFESNRRLTGKFSCL